MQTRMWGAVETGSENLPVTRLKAVLPDKPLVLPLLL
jgi:hypothetical protein